MTSRRGDLLHFWSEITEPVAPASVETSRKPKAFSIPWPDDRIKLCLFQGCLGGLLRNVFADKFDDLFQDREQSSICSAVVMKGGARTIAEPSGRIIRPRSHAARVIRSPMRRVLSKDAFFALSATISRAPIRPTPRASQSVDCPQSSEVEIGIAARQHEHYQIRRHLQRFGSPRVRLHIRLDVRRW